MKTNSDRFFNTRIKLRTLQGALFYGLFLLSVAVGIAGLGTLLVQVFSEGLPWISWHFLTNYPSRHPEEAGMMSADVQTKLELVKQNRKYEEKFGYIFIVCATGKSASGMLELLRIRLENSPESELKIAAGEQMKITNLRLNKMLRDA